MPKNIEKTFTPEGLVAIAERFLAASERVRDAAKKMRESGVATITVSKAGMLDGGFTAIENFANSAHVGFYEAVQNRDTTTRPGPAAPAKPKKRTT